MRFFVSRNRAFNKSAAIQTTAYSKSIANEFPQNIEIVAVKEFIHKSLIMITTGEDSDFVVDYFVNDAMFFINAARPAAF
jgi:hypothetical protein